MKNIMVIGSGTMGNGIAQVCAESGFGVILHDISKFQLEKAIQTIQTNINRKKAKRIISESVETILKRISLSTSLEDAIEADFVIEAATEKKEIKAAIFKELDRICREDVILATNTSSISITEIASSTNRPSLVIGMHFMNPVPVMPLVEIICGLETSETTLEATKKLVVHFQKTPAIANDYPGFISNRIFLAMMNEAFHCVYEGVGEPEEIDKVMKLGFNHPMGPLYLADLVGLDTLLYVLEVLWDGYRDSKYRPCPLLVKMVNSGRLGRKSGRGFYDYTTEEKL
ncbi:3-hydroxyacyl-CoA dehydrogenase NAD-binding domain-containing protein [Aneurinibacillus sp. Ricciae_BoGa-3]|uniref:3-hydroxyacyl-CoA dehydrogenase family protein n=1 Tax=Aneurinibacillus sp. Ricciae_BoGa-3 TaxID=3022697 RepID=UPI00234126E1|nr:3-hydroxyacyl-CoA dehydrogenase NAD-binding domain-containing protein [Aneurinibacillus sp. Ricciae_BoGa-3]WCK56251.1 3-hydroxyacyl-CoA dehydrogenase NAD-binding domain-containing protein [Aneurinibacillus sp. Ricciae_BoGa-3]